MEIVDYLACFVSMRGNASLAFGQDCVAFGADVSPEVADVLFGKEDGSTVGLLVKKTSKNGGTAYLGSSTRLRIHFRVTGENTRITEDGSEEHTTYVHIDDVETAPDLVTERAKALLAM